jgi:Flp pilus assembly protein TadG
MRHRQRGAEILEFALVLAPFLALFTLLMDFSWAIFSKSSIQRAFRVAVDQGVTLTSSDMA